MTLGIDIGNTNIYCALAGKNGKIARVYKTPTKKANINTLLEKISKKKIDKIMVVSVVPEALTKVKNALRKKIKGVRICVVGENVKVPLPCEYNKRQIGQDRLITAFAAQKLYGKPVLIIDFGTAVTFDAVSEKGAYIGGLILPGVKMSLESLSERTAMLPRAYLKKTRSFIGKNTIESIRNGMIYGYSAFCDGLINMFRRKIAKNIRVVATGGDAALISKYTPSMKKVDPHLSLKGLYLLSTLQ